NILQCVTHPNVVACAGCGAESDGALWMKLEYLQGETLRARAHRLGRLPVEEVLRLGRQVCQGLQELHKEGAVHRDIKPGNLSLVSPIDILKVLDFGLVKLPESTVRTTGKVTLGTALYVAPDYLDRDPDPTGEPGKPDPRWDLYSLGITMYELLIDHPFKL